MSPTTAGLLPATHADTFSHANAPDSQVSRFAMPACPIHRAFFAAARRSRAAAFESNECELDVYCDCLANQRVLLSMHDAEVLSLCTPPTKWHVIHLLLLHALLTTGRMHPCMPTCTLNAACDRFTPT